MCCCTACTFRSTSELKSLRTPWKPSSRRFSTSCTSALWSQSLISSLRTACMRSFIHSMFMLSVFAAASPCEPSFSAISDVISLRIAVLTCISSCSVSTLRSNKSISSWRVFLKRSKASLHVDCCAASTRSATNARSALLCNTRVSSSVLEPNNSSNALTRASRFSVNSLWASSMDAVLTLAVSTISSRTASTISTTFSRSAFAAMAVSKRSLSAFCSMAAASIS
mmetsp:Transcript_87468/g.245565  ORF Transcript_87468/g.245565 Transcript_87468/m.245565 type:complete len:225 (-) Transcript_87468:1058-1732(-)